MSRIRVISCALLLTLKSVAGCSAGRVVSLDADGNGERSIDAGGTLVRSQPSLEVRCGDMCGVDVPGSGRCVSIGALDESACEAGCDVMLAMRNIGDGDKPLLISRIALTRAGSNDDIMTNDFEVRDASGRRAVVTPAFPLVLPSASSGGRSAELWLHRKSMHARGVDPDLRLIIESNDPERQPFLALPIELRHPMETNSRIDVAPSEEVLFPPNVATVQLRNIGTGPLLVGPIRLVDITGAIVDDFRIEMLDPSQVTMLCPGREPLSLRIRYDNNDHSSVDVAELRIASSDPSDSDHVLVMLARP